MRGPVSRSYSHTTPERSVKLDHGVRGRTSWVNEWVAQVDWRGCELILFAQWPDKGKGLMFISLNVGVLDALRSELEGRGVDVKNGQWGYRLMVIADLDGNELYFPYPASTATGSGVNVEPGTPR